MEQTTLENCVICKENINIDDSAIELECTHNKDFHKSCLDTWIHIKCKCPLCNSPIQHLTTFYNFENGSNSPEFPEWCENILDCIIYYGIEKLYSNVPESVKKLHNILIGILYIIFSFVFTFALLVPMMVIFVFPFTKIGKNICTLLFSIFTTYFIITSLEIHNSSYYDFMKMYYTCTSNLFII